MKIDQLRSLAIIPALSLLPTQMGSTAAIRLLQTIALQESNLMYRRQINGPARGYWQFELGGGVKGVLTHNATKSFAFYVCEVLNYKPSPDVVYSALENNDILAAAFARLLLWSDPSPIPSDNEGMWQYYLRNWRPGAYTRGSEAEKESLRMKFFQKLKMVQEN